LAAYKGVCAVTASDFPATLEAAHIRPYIGPDSNHVQNGLLLRSDIHALFDLGLLAIDTTSMSCVLDHSLIESFYASLKGQKLRLPAQLEDRPSAAALEAHREWAQL
jgi:predicted restriction endonuclease